MGKLYTNTFYNLVKRVLKPEGQAVIQATSPFVAPNSYWCVVNTLQAVGFKTLPYHAHVPSFGDWGFVMATLGNDFAEQPEFLPELKFLNKATFAQMSVFPKDMPGKKTEINKLNNKVLVHYFEQEWAQYLN